MFFNWIHGRAAGWARPVSKHKASCIASLKSPWSTSSRRSHQTTPNSSLVCKNSLWMTYCVLTESYSHLLVPVGQSHHHVECGEGEHHVEEAPAVGDRLFLVVPDLFAAVTAFAAIVTCQRGIRFYFRITHGKQK